MVPFDWTDLSVEELIKGYGQEIDSKQFTCSLCGKHFEEGEVFSFEGRWFTAEKMAQLHVEREHTDQLNYLLAIEKKYTGLTENQKDILQYMYQGLSDKEIARQQGVTSATIRHQRFKLKERAKQAKVFLAIYELALQGAGKGQGSANPEELKAARDKEEFIKIHPGATMVDDRYMITEEESDKILTAMFSSLVPLKLKTFDTKEKKKLVILRKIAATLDAEKHYTEMELNQVLKEIYEDFATLRRYLIQYGFLDRTKDGAEYWVKS